MHWGPISSAIWGEAMRELIFLAHRIPYPPNKGDKIRSWNIFQHLLGRYRIHLGCFIDDPFDRQYEAVLRRQCGECCFIRLNPAVAKISSLRGLLAGAPLTLPYYYSPRLRIWLKDILTRRKPEWIFIYSSAMAQYAEAVKSAQIRRIIDFVDVDSEKWREYAERSAWPLSWLYRREHMTLLRYERRVAKLFDVSLFASSAEAALFRSLAPEVAGKVFDLTNGVDSAYFAPEGFWADPYRGDRHAIVFVGAMDYRANIDAVCFFADHVFQSVRRKVPDATFYIVGANPTSKVSNLGRWHGVTVTGRVADVRPYLAHAGVVVAPLQIARGIQNKVLEAMAMAKTVVATPQALDGIEAEAGRDVLVAETPTAFADAVVVVLTGESQHDIGTNARRCVSVNHDWQSSLARLDKILDKPMEALAHAEDELMGGEASSPVRL